MPTYDYRCEENGKTVEVMHRMSEKISTWGELCQKAGIDTGDTAPETPVMKLATGGNLISSENRGSGFDPAPACNTGSCCAGGMCGLE
jgi:putative FmdB family regulatory protein